ncbi:hypothetical protein ALUC_81146A [Aspergillus luchuensis]|nr:hypothetical protein ALUC_81146A [Aspergillus luchuensis]
MKSPAMAVSGASSYERSAMKPDRNARDAPDCRIHVNINTLRVPADRTQSWEVSQTP